MLSSFSISLFLPLRKMIESNRHSIELFRGYTSDANDERFANFHAKLYNDKLKVKCERDELVFWLEIITAPAGSCRSLPAVC